MRLEDSQTLIHLMRAFAGECQAWERYTFAAAQMKKQRLHVLEKLFQFTAQQEKEHAELFSKRLALVNGKNLAIQAEYPVAHFEDALSLLNAARQGETQEYERDYAFFADVAAGEGFADIETLFRGVGRVEKTHADRFARYIALMEGGRLFEEGRETGWLCLNCGHVHYGTSAPSPCPICDHAQGYYIRQEAPLS